MVLVCSVAAGVRCCIDGRLSLAAKSLVVTDGQRPWIHNLEPCSSKGRNYYNGDIVQFLKEVIVM